MTGHLSKNCQDKERRTKCFRFNKFGHIASNYKSTPSNENRVTFFESGKEINCFKNIIVENVNLRALIDTGSALNLLREDVIKEMASIVLSTSKHKAVGFGGANVETKGSCQSETLTIQHIIWICMWYQWHRRQ